MSFHDKVQTIVSFQRKGMLSFIHLVSRSLMLKPACHRVTSFLRKVNRTTFLNNLMVTSATKPQFRNKCKNSSRGNTHKKFSMIYCGICCHSKLLFVLRKWWLLNKEFCCINNYPSVKVFLEIFGELAHDLLMPRPLQLHTSIV